jgi:uncharacterized protein (DUF2267 family)
MNNIKKLTGFLDNRVRLGYPKSDREPNDGVEIDITILDVNNIYEECIWKDLFKGRYIEEGIGYLEQIENKTSPKEEVDEFVKRVRAERSISDSQIKKLKKEVIEYLNQIKKEISNTEIEKLKETIDEIWCLRVELIDYIIETKNEISDEEIKKLRNYYKEYKLKTVFFPKIKMKV